ncbi:toxin-antitoxin system, toxin component, PIN family protein [Prosthecomicrobium hirschii]|uniref:Toxin-antitoxin system, toxin component, PIN family protein n=1 Tax=Prosthecodimorpha hirschii TaxID=665126 RepID=A0A0N8GEI7_9HYPH|nr:DUF5615 family PIN-like protein [Prosthecomicrobium hirschii]KPL51633.1 toxin-antitoxin system, toxin component, PIN family protein [Prosthecomicrobium hirschii]
MIDPFLIDECLYPGLVGVANARGHHATHVVHRGLQGRRDEHLMPFILQGNFIFVTSNTRDFLRLYAREAIHPGLILFLPGNLDRDLQAEFFAIALDTVEAMDDLINKVVEVRSDRSVTIRTLSKG